MKTFKTLIMRYVLAHFEEVNQPVGFYAGETMGLVHMVNKPKDAKLFRSKSDAKTFRNNKKLQHYSILTVAI